MQELISRIKKGNPRMKYDFDTVVNRRNTDSLKWNVAENELPMWVADMDFKTAPEITEAIKAKADLGVYGYTEISKDWYDAYTGWWERRHNFRMEDDWLMFVTGVIPAISSSVRKLTTPAENVVIMTPVYNIFFNSILNNGRNVLQSQLAYENGRYVIDFEDLEVIRVEMYGERKNLHVSESLLTSMESLLYLMRFTASLQTRALIMCHLQVFRRCVRIYL